MKEDNTNLMTELPKETEGRTRASKRIIKQMIFAESAFFNLKNYGHKTEIEMLQHLLQFNL